MTIVTNSRMLAMLTGETSLTPANFPFVTVSSSNYNYKFYYAEKEHIPFLVLPKRLGIHEESTLTNIALSCSIKELTMAPVIFRSPGSNFQICGRNSSPSERFSGTIDFL